jgi:hypothetical protein
MGVVYEAEDAKLSPPLTTGVRPPQVRRTTCVEMEDYGEGTRKAN